MVASVRLSRTLNPQNVLLKLCFPPFDGSIDVLFCSSLCLSGERSSRVARDGNLPCLSLNSSFVCLINLCASVL